VDTAPRRSPSAHRLIIYWLNSNRRVDGRAVRRGGLLAHIYLAVLDRSPNLSFAGPGRKKLAVELEPANTRSVLYLHLFRYICCAIVGPPERAMAPRGSTRRSRETVGITIAACASA
jgi:hypothetical protein